MPQFTLHRDYVLRTTKGHAIRFRKNQPTHVPPECVEEAVHIGAQAIDEQVDILGDDTPDIVLTPTQRLAKVEECILLMVKRNERNDFTGSGLPDLRKLSPLAGFDVTKQERDTAWQAYRESLAEEQFGMSTEAE